jgi:F-type H+-transporting ATPase subunit gamma
MAGLKETRERIKSVKNTKKITYAMKLVSAAKLGKAQDAAKSFSYYNENLQNLLANTKIAMQGSTAVHPLTTERDKIKKSAVIVVGASRGLCGAFNANVNKAVENFIAETKGEIDFYLYGKKPAEYFRNKSINYKESFENLTDYPDTWGIEKTLEKLIDSYLKQEIDAVYIIYTNFVSALNMHAKPEKILPLNLEFTSENIEVARDVSLPAKFEPSVSEVYSELLPRVIKANLRRATLDSKAGEHASRMTAMDAATKNAGDLIDSLTLTYNKARQSGITSEMLDIVGGAEAIK